MGLVDFLLKLLEAIPYAPRAFLTHLYTVVGCTERFEAAKEILPTRLYSRTMFLGLTLIQQFNPVANVVSVYGAVDIIQKICRIFIRMKSEALPDHINVVDIIIPKPKGNALEKAQQIAAQNSLESVMYFTHANTSNVVIITVDKNGIPQFEGII